MLLNFFDPGKIYGSCEISENEYHAGKAVDKRSLESNTLKTFINNRNRRVRLYDFAL